MKDVWLEGYKCGAAGQSPENDASLMSRFDGVDIMDHRDGYACGQRALIAERLGELVEVFEARRGPSGVLTVEGPLTEQQKAEIEEAFEKMRKDDIAEADAGLGPPWDGTES